MCDIGDQQIRPFCLRRQQLDRHGGLCIPERAKQPFNSSAGRWHFLGHQIAMSNDADEQRNTQGLRCCACSWRDHQDDDSEVMSAALMVP
jgi:hypothetical protein